MEIRDLVFKKTASGKNNELTILSFIVISIVLGVICAIGAVVVGLSGVGAILVYPLYLFTDPLVISDTYVGWEAAFILFTILGFEFGLFIAYWIYQKSIVIPAVVVTVLMLVSLIVIYNFSLDTDFFPIEIFILTALSIVVLSGFISTNSRFKQLIQKKTK